MPKQVEYIRLKVLEALQDDAYKGVARIDTEVMRALGLKRGDIISIKGERETVAIVDRSYPADIGEGIIRIDGLTRKNAKTGLGEKVIIKKATIKPAKKVSIAPTQQGVVVQGDPEVFKSGLLGRALVKGDIISLGGAQRRRDLMGDMEDVFGDIQELFGANFGFSGFQHIRFNVISTNPGQPVIVTEDTEVTVSPKAVAVTEETLPEVSYEDIGGLKDEIKKIREMVEMPLKHPEVFDRLGIDPPKGVLLHGPPGTGKTLLAKAVANESDANFILLNGPEVMSKFYGESEKKIRDLFEDAEKNAPSIIFIDEIDAIAPKREEVQGEVERRVVSQLLTMMDGLNPRGRVIVIGATNRVNSIDQALRRPGRFDRELEISVPDKEGRLNILKIHTRAMPLQGTIYPEVLKEAVLDKFDSQSKNLSKEISNAEKEIEKLQQEERIAEKSLIQGIINKIKRNQSKIEENKDKLEGLSGLKNELSNEKKKFDNLIKKFTEVYNAKRQAISFNDARTLLIQNANNPREKEITEKLYSLNIIDKELFGEVQKAGIEIDVKDLAAKTHGFVGADLASLAKEAAMNVLRKVMPEMKMEEEGEVPQEVLDKIIIGKEDFEEALRVVRPSAMREVLVETPNVTWEQIGGLEKTKQELKEAVEWPIKHRASFERMGIRPPKGVLLYGSPGTGKTLLAKAVAKESEANFIQVKGPSLLSMWVGKSEEGIRKVFERARQVAPCVIFFDEIDSLAGKRGMDQGTKVTERVLNQMLAEMDGIEDLKGVVVIGATNRPDMLDSALLRPGRFDRVLLVDVPDKESRKKVFEIHLKNTKLDKSVNIDELVRKTEGFVGADIENLVREAAILALRKNINADSVSMAEFEEALAKVRPSVSEETAKRYKRIEDNYIKSAKAGGLPLGPVYAG